MMDISKKAEEHRVEHVHSGKNHFFKVKSNSGEEYDVAVGVVCSCRFYSVEGAVNGWFCSHILAVLDKIVGGGVSRLKKSDDKRE